MTISNSKYASIFFHEFEEHEYAIGINDDGEIFIDDVPFADSLAPEHVISEVRSIYIDD